MLKHRLIFGALMIAGLLLALYLDDRLDRVDIEGTWWQSLFLGRTYLPSGVLLLALLVGLIAFAARELARIFAAKGIQVAPSTLWVSGVVGCVLIYMLPQRLDSQTALAIYATALVVVFIFALIRHAWRGRSEGAVGVASATLFALIYLGTLPGFFLAIRQWHSVWVLAAIILITKTCDIGAYFTGRAIGRHKLVPWLSPGKTWEGLLGGVLFSAGIAVALTAMGNAYGLTGQWVRVDGERDFVPFAYPLLYAAAGGLLLGLVGQFGDLTASLFKRDAGIKDSGGLIPGFGGLLDVVDSPLIVAPVAYWLLQGLMVLYAPA